jgi:phosphatidyl-myo-inositol dimannoside synthase
LAACVAALCPRRTPRLLMVAHGIEVWSGIHRLRRLALERLWKILCVSTYTKKRILEQVSALAESRLVIFPNALSDAWSLTKEAEVSTNIRRLPEKFILSVTRLDSAERYKGILAVLEAVTMLEDQSIHYVVAGDGDDLEFLRGASVHLGIEARVHFLHAVTDEELRYLYRHCLSFILPSGKEGFGIVYLEAMFFGAPVIAAREKGVIDVVEDGESGLLVSYGDTIAIVAALERLIADGDLRSRLIDNARKLVTAGGPFTSSAFTGRLAAVLEASAERTRSESFPEMPLPEAEGD